MAKKGVVKDWTKNAASGVKYTTLELANDSAPFITNTISNAASAIKDMTDWVKRNSPEKSANGNRDPFIKRAVTKTKDLFVTAFEDLKSGDLRFSGINSKFSNGMSDMFGDFGFDDNMFGDFGSEDEAYSDDSYGDSDSSFESEGLSNEVYASGMELSTKANIAAISESSTIISESNLKAAQLATKQIAAMNFANTVRLSSQLADIIINTKASNDNLASLVDFSNNTLSPFMSQAQQYMENTEQTLNDIKAILETRLANPEKENEDYQRKDIFRGGIDFKEYFKRISGSLPVQSMIAQFAPAISLLGYFGVPIPQFIKESPFAMTDDFNPIKSIAKFTLPSLFGEKSVLKDLDDILEGTVLRLADKISNIQFFDDFGQKLYKKGYLYRSDYDKGSVVWTGKDSRVLQDVVPTYLSHIELNTEETVDRLDDMIDLLNKNISNIGGGGGGGGKSRKKKKKRKKQGGEPATDESIEDNTIDIGIDFGGLDFDDDDEVLLIEDDTPKKYRRRDRKTRYNRATYWDVESGSYTSISKIKENYEFEVNGLYAPFGHVYEYIDKLMTLDADAKKDIEALVTKWANASSSDTDTKTASGIADYITGTYAHCVKQKPDGSPGQISRFERDKLANMLMKAKVEYLRARAELLKAINSGESIYSKLDDDYIETRMGSSKYQSFEDTQREMIYAIGNKQQIEDYERNRALREKRKAKEGLPFADALSKEEYIAQNGAYDPNADAIDRFFWKLGSRVNSAQGVVNSVYKALTDNKVNRAAGKMTTMAYGGIADLFTKIVGIFSDDTMSVNDRVNAAVNSAKDTASDIASQAGRQAANGARMIKEEGLWLLHPGERVLTPEEVVAYDNFLEMIKRGEVVNTNSVGDIVKSAMEKINAFQNSFIDGSDYSQYEDLRTLGRNNLDDLIRAKYGEGAKLLGLFNGYKDAVVRRDDGKLERFTYTRRKPLNEDERNHLDDFTNRDVERATTKEEALYNVQMEQAENIRSIAALTAANSERSIIAAREDSIESTKTFANTILGKLTGALFGDRDENGFFTNGPLADFANKAINAKRRIFYNLFGKGYVDSDGNVVEGKDIVQEAKDKLYLMANDATDTLLGNNGEVVADGETARKVLHEKLNSRFGHIFGEPSSDDGTVVEEVAPEAKQPNDSEPHEETALMVINSAAESVADNIIDAGNETVDAAFGDAKNRTKKIKEVTTKTNKQVMADYLSKIGKGALIGGIAGLTLQSSLGTIPSMFLPGGPIGGALLGVGATLLSNTETFKKIVFGNIDEETGERTGGLISKQMSERFKKAVPFIVGGAGIGLLQKFFLPTASLLPGPGGALMNLFFGNGPIAGALLGLGGGLLASSEKFRKVIFGEEDENGKLFGGILSGPTEKIRKFFGKNGAGIKAAGLGALTGLIGNRIAAVKFGGSGLLYHLFGAGGPIGAAILGSAVGIAVRSEKFQEMLFGKDTGQVDANGNPIRDKSGLFNKILNVFQVNVVRPVAEWGAYARDSFVNWLKHDLGDHVKSIFYPLKEALGEAADKVDVAFSGLGSRIFKIIDLTIHPVKKLLPALLKLGVNMTLGTVTSTAKVLGSTISAPLKLIDFMMNASPIRGMPGKTSKKANLDFQNDVYGGGKMGGLKNWFDFTFRRSKWNEEREKWGNDHGVNPGSGFFYYSRKEQAKLDKKDVTDEYKRKKGITKKIQKWAKEDNFNNGIILDEDELERRKKFLAKRGVDTEGWSNQDLVDFMYSNDEKRKAKIQADEDSKLQRNANQAEIKTSKAVEDINEKLTVVANHLMGNAPGSGNVDTNGVTLTSTGGAVEEIVTGNSAENPGYPASPFTDDNTKLLPMKDNYLLTTSDVYRIPAYDANGNPIDSNARNSKFKLSPNKKYNKQKKHTTTAPVLSTGDRNDDTVDASEIRDVERKTKTGEGFSVNDMPSKGATDTFVALTAVQSNNVKREAELKAKEKADAKTAQSQALSGKNDEDVNANSIATAIVDNVDDDGDEGESKFGSIISKIGKIIGGGVGITLLWKLAQKIDWSAIGNSIKTGISGLIENFKESTEDSRIYIDEETGEAMVAPSALDARSVLPKVGKSAYQFITGNNILAMMNQFGAKGKFRLINNGGLLGWMSNKSGRALNKAAWNLTKKAAAPAKSIATGAANSLHNGMNYGKALVKYGDDVLEAAPTVERAFARIYKVVDGLNNSKALKWAGGTWIGKIADSFSTGFKNIFKKFKTLLSKPKNAAKISDACAKGAGKAAVKSADDFVPILNIITGATDAIVGTLNVANLFYLADPDDANIRMRTIAAAIGWLRGTMIVSLLDIIVEIIKDATGYDVWHELAVGAYRVIADEIDEAELDASMDQVEAECQAYNEANGTQLTVEQYNANVKNRTVGTKIMQFFGFDPTKAELERARQDKAHNDSLANLPTYNAAAVAVNSSASVGTGDGSNAIGYGIDHYTQNDPRWARRKYARRNNGMMTSMGTGGCGPTALANAASQLGVNVNPVQVANMARANGYTADGGTNAKMFTDGVKKLGLKSTNIGRGGVRSALKSGRKVILSGKGSDGIYTKAGHIISARGLDSKGNAIVDDPLKRRSRRVPISKLTSHSTHAWAIGYGPDITPYDAWKQFSNPEHGLHFPHPYEGYDNNNNPDIFFTYQQTYGSDNQYNPRDWSNAAIGNDTVGNSGCIMTALGNALTYYTNRDFDPGTMAYLFSNDFDSSGSLKASSTGKNVWDIINHINDYVKEHGSDVSPLVAVGGSRPGSSIYNALGARISTDEYDPATDWEYKVSTYFNGNEIQVPYIVTNSTQDSDMTLRKLLNPPTETGVFANGLWRGNPVVMFGKGNGGASVLYGNHSQHAVIVKGIFEDPKTGELSTQIFDPGQRSRNGSTLPLSTLYSKNILSNTYRVAGFLTEENRKDADFSFDALDFNGVNNAITNNVLGGDYNPDANQPATFSEAILNFMKRLNSIADNIFAALGTKDFTYASIFDENKTSSLIGENGFNESVREYTQNLGDTYYTQRKYADKYTYDVIHEKSAAFDYKQSARQLGITPEMIQRLREDETASTPFGNYYKNIPDIQSASLPMSVIEEMKAKLMPMIAMHEVGSLPHKVITDTNGYISLGIGGFNATNAAEVMDRLAARIDERIDATEEGSEYIDNSDNKFFRDAFTSLSLEKWQNNSERLKKYAKFANSGHAFSTSEENDISSILRDAGEHAKEIEVAVLDDLLNEYLSEPLKHYDAKDLLDPRTIMLMAEFAGFGTAHLENSRMWDLVKKHTKVMPSPSSNLAAVRDAMIDFYQTEGLAYYSDDHSKRIAATAATLNDDLDESNTFIPGPILPGAKYGIQLSNVDGNMRYVYSMLNEAADKGKIDRKEVGRLAEIAKTAYTQMDKTADGITIKPADMVQQISGDRIKSTSLSGATFKALGYGTGGYSESDIYTDEYDIQRYNANNPLPVTMNTRPIESRVDVIIQLLRQLIQTANTKSSEPEGYGRAYNPITNNQQLENAGIRTNNRIPLYNKDINENYVDPLRQLFQTIAATPR